VLLLAVRALWRGVAPATPGYAVTAFVVDVNAASVGELETLPGVGPRRAEALVLERIRRGPFTCLADLERVRGFGAASRRRLAPFVRFSRARPPPCAPMRGRSLSGSLPGR
jgi:competence protein ComEA